MNYSPGDARERLTVMNVIEVVLIEGSSEQLMGLLQYK